jgi:N-acetylglucosaminyldiphosphoundecaprenol N-acetyl-beta-D-mannosaminyltransferase
MRGLRERVDILGTAFDPVSMDGTLLAISDAIRRREALWIITGNVHYVMKARRDVAFAALLPKAHLIVPDGVPILWAAKLFKTPLAGRVNGTDLVWRCAQLSSETGARVVLIGSTPQVLGGAANMLKQRYPNATIVSVATPFVSSVDALADTAHQVAAAGCDVLLTGLPTGLQEAWIERYHALTTAPVVIGVGSAFDIISGRVARAPRWMQRVGLEWLWRMSREPRRLWRRYLVEDVGFFHSMIRARARQRKRDSP